MAYTLAQLAKLETQAFKKGVIMGLLRYTQLMEVIPWENVSSLQSLAIKWRKLPSGGAFRKINAGYTEDTSGDVDQVWESVYPFGGEVRFDRIFDSVKNTIVDPKINQMNMKLKALALEFNDYFINGDQAVDPDGVEGLKKRVANMPTRQTIYFAPAAGAALDPTSAIASARAFLDHLEEVVYKCMGKPSALFMNEGMVWGLGRVLRYAQISGGNVLDITKDSFDRDIPTYKGIPLVDVGLKTDQSTEIITDTEVGGNGAANATSLYGVSFGTDEGFTGIQLHDLQSYDPLTGGELESAPVKMTRIEWPIGFASFGSFCITRGVNVEGASNWT